MVVVVWLFWCDCGGVVVLVWLWKCGCGGGGGCGGVVVKVIKKLYALC